MTVTEKIKLDYGTVKRFCRVKGISYTTVLNTMAGDVRNKTINSMLIDMGYINCPDDLKKGR